MHRTVVLVASAALLFSTAVGQAGATLGVGPGGSVKIDDAGAYADTELMAGLKSVGLLDEWFQDGTGSPSVATLRIADAPEYDTARAALFVQIAKMKADLVAGADRSPQLDLIESEVGALELLATELRRWIVTGMNRPDDLSTLNARPADDLGSKKPTGIGLLNDEHPVDVVQRRFFSIKAKLSGQYLHALQGLAGGQKALDTTVLYLAQARRDLSELRELVGVARTVSLDAQSRLSAHRAEVVELIEVMQSLRPLAPSDVSGLPVVVLDAYVNAASMNAERCDIDWTVLAGIGRVESFHGTLDGSSVQHGGDLSKSIYGPLLDGGASTRPDPDDAPAEDDSEVSEHEEAAESAHDPLLWGQPQPEPLSDQEAADGFDPLLWGARPYLPVEDPLDEVSDDAADDDDDEAPEESDEPTGNGFAVIADTDNGVLDRNAEWDRAIGPMQFIPETWDRWKIDGNADGVIDPQNLFDAAATAGRFLCYLKGRFGPSPQSYLLGYNESSRYVSDVLRVANSLAERPLPEVSFGAD